METQRVNYIATEMKVRFSLTPPVHKLPLATFARLADMILKRPSHKVN